MGRPKYTTENLTPKQHLFLDNYCNPARETFGNALKAYLAAGYKPCTNNHQAASRMLVKSHIKEALAIKKAAIEQKSAISVGYIQSEHLRIRGLAEEKGDLSTATANLVALGKTIAAYADKNINFDDKTPIIGDDERLLLVALATEYKRRMAAKSINAVEKPALLEEKQ